MGDPVTMAVIGGTIGAATSKDPIKGAMLGAAGGYAGGSFIGANAATAGAGAAGSANAFIPGVQGGMGALAPSTVGGMAPMTTALTGTTAPTGFMANTFAGMGQDLSAVQGWANKNPLIAGMALNTASNMMQPDPLMQAPPSAPIQARGLPDNAIGGILAQQMQRQPISLI